MNCAYEGSRLCAPYEHIMPGDLRWSRGHDASAVSSCKVNVMCLNHPGNIIRGKTVFHENRVFIPKRLGTVLNNLDQPHPLKSKSVATLSGWMISKN